MECFRHWSFSRGFKLKTFNSFASILKNFSFFQKKLKGWTSYLSGHTKTVVAVDPALMHEDILKIPNVVHLQQKFENLTIQDFSQWVKIFLLKSISY